MYSALFCILITLYAWRQKNTYLAVLLLPSIFFFLLAYEIKNSTLSAEYFEFARVSDYSMYIIFGFFQVAATLLALSRKISGQAPDLRSPTPLPQISIKEIVFVYYALAAISIAAFIINLSHVDFSIELLFINAREYEEIFGQSFAVNYLYFLNIPALCLSIYLKQQKHQRHKFLYFLDVSLILISLFHGIKFTVFDTMLLPAFFYFHCSRHPRKSLYILLLTLTLLLIFYLAFSLSVRGFSEEDGSLFSAVLNYILPNYYNLAYALQLQPIQFEPIGFFIPDKIPNPFLSILSPGSYGFTLNDRFNMPTAYGTIYSVLPFFSWLFFIPLLVRWRQRLVRLKFKYQTINLIFIAAYIDFCLFFFWYFFAFNKTKYVYYVAVMAAISYWLHRRQNWHNSRAKHRTKERLINPPTTVLASLDP